MLVDRKFSLTGELKDDTKETSYEALGLASYSNSKPPFLSYVTIFDTLWKQVILYIEIINTDYMYNSKFIVRCKSSFSIIDNSSWVNLFIRELINSKNKEGGFWYKCQMFVCIILLN